MSRGISDARHVTRLPVLNVSISAAGSETPVCNCLGFSHFNDAPGTQTQRLFVSSCVDFRGRSLEVRNRQWLHPPLCVSVASTTCCVTAALCSPPSLEGASLCGGVEVGGGWEGSAAVALSILDEFRCVQPISSSAMMNVSHQPASEPRGYRNTLNLSDCQLAEGAGLRWR